MNNLRHVITNTMTNKQIVKPQATEHEVEIFDNSVFVSETDLEGNIVYMNRRYIAITGYDEEELFGSPYQLIRHPDMPKGVYKAMWKIISANKIWRGYIKHLTKDGSYFWTLTYIHAKVDNEGSIVGYSSTAKVAHKESREEVENRYRELQDDKDIDHKYFMLSENYYETQILPKVSLAGAKKRK